MSHPYSMLRGKVLHHIQLEPPGEKKDLEALVEAFQQRGGVFTINGEPREVVDYWVTDPAPHHLIVAYYEKHFVKMEPHPA